MPLNAQPVFIACWYRHEKWFLEKDIDGVRQDVQRCLMRAKWNNLLCAHPGFGNDIVYATQEELIQKRINRIYKHISRERWLILEQKRIHVKMAIKVLDDMVYVSYKNSIIRGQFYHWNIAIKELILGYDEIIWILERAGLYLREDRERPRDKSEYDSMRKLNAWERNRFNYLIKQAQFNIQKYYLNLFKELDILEE